MFAGLVRLNVGQVAVLSLSSDEIVVLFRTPFKTKRDERFAVYLDPSNPIYPAVPVDSGVCQFSPANFRAIPRTLWTAHESFIDAAANAKKVSPFKTSFSDGVLQHLETLLGLPLPRPTYFTGTSLDSPLGVPVHPTGLQLPFPTGAGFGDPEQNKMVEQAAVLVAKQRYLAEGWQVTSVESQKCGFDLRCQRNGTEVHVEVKGVAGSERRFIVTDGELQCANIDDRFVLALVTLALTDDPQLERWSAQSFRDEFSFKPIQYWATALTRRPEAKPR
jgi:hypothetical protein